ncbi:hypothetical protein ACROYT_G029436 [Oculina patagonica]
MRDLPRYILPPFTGPSLSQGWPPVVKLCVCTTVLLLYRSSEPPHVCSTVALLLLCHCPTGTLCHCGNVTLTLLPAFTVPTYSCDSFPSFHFAAVIYSATSPPCSVSLSQCSTVVTVLLFYFVTVSLSLFDRATVPLYLCSTVALCLCFATAPLYPPPLCSVPLCHRFTVQLFNDWFTESLSAHARPPLCLFNCGLDATVQVLSCASVALFH